MFTLARKIGGRMRDTFAALREVFKLISAIDRKLMWYQWGAAFGSALITMGSFLAAGYLFSYVNGLAITPLILMLFIAYNMMPVVHALSLGNYREYRQHIFNRSIWVTIDQWRLKKHLSLDIAKLVSPEFLKAKVMVDRRGHSAPVTMWQQAILLARSAVQLIVGSIALFMTVPSLMALVVAPVIVAIVMRWRSQAFARDVEEKELVTRWQQGHTLWELTNHHSGFQMRLMGLRDMLEERYHDFTKELLANNKKVAMFNVKSNTIVYALNFVSLGIFWAFFGRSMLNGAYTFTQIGAIIGGYHLVYNAMRDFGFAIAQIDHTAVDFGYLQTFLAMKPIIKEEKAKPIELQETPKIEVKDVFFRYPKLEDDDHERPMVLKGTTLTLMPGDKAAFIGLNGSGKTTLCQLLANVYHPTGGQILIDGKPLSLIKQDSWHEHLFYLPQNPRIPELLLEQAMTGDKPGEVDVPRLQKALQYAFADKLVDGLEEKLKTWLGRQWPGGRDFSTGQYQRLCITLVFYRLLHPKTRMAIFDEPMANCDYETRDRFYPAVTSSPDFADKTIITISHDKEYMHHFSRIIGFEDGRASRDMKDQMQQK